MASDLHTLCSRCRSLVRLRLVFCGVFSNPFPILRQRGCATAVHQHFESPYCAAHCYCLVYFLLLVPPFAIHSVSDPTIGFTVCASRFRIFAFPFEVVCPPDTNPYSHVPWPISAFFVITLLSGCSTFYACQSLLQYLWPARFSRFVRKLSFFAGRGTVRIYWDRNVRMISRLSMD